MDFLIDPSREAFLDDHVVGGTPLLPTVLGLDLVVRSQRPAADPHRRVTELRDVVVGDPVRFRGGLPRRLVTTARAASHGDVQWEVRSDVPLPHWTAVVPGTSGSWDEQRPRWATTPGESAGLSGRDLYPPYFHGPTFRVVRDVRNSGGVLHARYAEGLPRLAWSFGPLAFPARLLELVLQTCGVWHLADTGRTMIPSRIGRVAWASLTRAPGPYTVPTASVAVTGTGDHGERLLSGVVTVADEVVLAVDSYETVDLGVAVDARRARRLHHLLTTEGATS